MMNYKNTSWKNRCCFFQLYGIMMLVIHLSYSNQLKAQNPFIITPNTSGGFVTNVGHYTFVLPNEIRNQITNGFRVDATFNTTGMNASDKTFIFGVGMVGTAIDVFRPFFMVYIQNGQIILERVIETPSGSQMFSIPSWNTNMYQYGKSNVHLYFWIDDYAMKMYMFEGSTNLSAHDVKRSCELQFYGMNSSLAKTHFTDGGQGDFPTIVVPQKASYFLQTNIAIAQDIRRSPIPMDAVQGGEAAVLNSPLCGGNAAVGFQARGASETTHVNNKPLDLNDPAFKNLPTSYTIVQNEEPTATDDTFSNDPISVYPVPAEDQILIDLVAPQRSSGRIEIVDMMGQPVYQEVISIDEGRNEYKVSLKDHALTAGMYFVRIRTLSGVNTHETGSLYTTKVILK